jgi:hypothetical protein
MRNGTQMTKVKRGAGLGIGTALIPFLMIFGKLTGSVMRAFILGAGVAFIMGLAGWLKFENDADSRD